MTTPVQLNGIRSFYAAVGAQDPVLAASTLRSLPTTPCVSLALMPFAKASDTLTSPLQAVMANQLRRLPAGDDTAKSAIADMVSRATPDHFRAITGLLRIGKCPLVFHSDEQFHEMVLNALSGKPLKNDGSRETAAALVGPTNPVAVSTRPQGPVRVLLVEDDEAICRTVARTINRYGGKVTHSAQTPEQIGALMSGGVDVSQFDVAFIDYNLGTSVTGIDVIRWLREQGAAYPIYLSTSDWNDTYLIGRAEAVEATGVIDKVIIGKMEPDKIREYLGTTDKV